MDFGIVTAKVDEIGYITHAENLGYSHCWVTDSQMIRSNCFAVLALAATQTRTMRIGTGVNVPGLRLAPVAANGIATINRLAPGRTFMSLGTGHTAMRTIGQRPMRMKPFAEYIRTVRGLLDGGVVDYTLDDQTHPIAFQMREHRFIDLEPRIPLYVAGYGPRAQALAGELGDGLVTGFPRGGTIAEALGHVRRGAEQAGRELEGFYTAAMMTLMILAPGESITSDRVLDQCGAAIMSGMHYFVNRYEESGEEPPAYARSMWKDYLAFLNERPPEVRHRLLHESHYSAADPDELRFITPELVRETCLIGTPDAVIDKLRELEGEGLDQVMLYPPLNRMFRVIEDFADTVMARL